MRPAPAAPHRHPLALAAVLSALALAGCSRDLALPSPPAGPTITGLSPAAAFAGQLLHVSGANFDADATSNTVHFAGASARGERFDGAALVVRVPADAGDGPITVANREGTSTASADPFDYQGLGEPARLQVASSSPILQRPRAVFPIGGDVILDSALYGGLVWVGNAGFSTPAIERSASDPDLGILYYVFTDLVSGTQLVAFDAAKGMVTGTAVLPDVPHQVLPLAGRDLVLTFHTSDAGDEVVAGWTATDLAPVFAESAYGVGSFEGAADIGDGRAVVAGLEPDFDPFEPMLFVVDFRGAPSPPPPAVEVACPISFPDPAGPPGGPCPPVMATNSSFRVPIAASSTPGGGAAFAAVAIDDGNVVIADVSTYLSPPYYVKLVETFSPAPIEAMALGGTGVGVATKPDAGYAFGFEYNGSSLVEWIVDLARPTSVATLGQMTTMGMVDLAFVASASDNDVVVVNASTGLKIGRVNFDVKPRVEGWTAAFLDSGSGLEGDLLFPATAFPGLLRIPTGSGTPSAISRLPLPGPGDVDLLASSAGDGIFWHAHGGTPPRLDGYLGYLDGGWDTAISAELSGAPQRLAARGALAVVAHDGGLSMVDGTAPPLLAPTAAIPGAELYGPAFLGVGFTASGDVWTLVGLDDSTTRVQLWPTAAIQPGGAPAASFTVPGTALAAVPLEEGLWVLHLDGAGDPVATLLDDALQAVRTVPSNPRLLGVTAVSPNGRLIAFRELGGALGYVLRFFRADPAAGFPEEGSLVFTERVEGLAFDAAGERLYVLTQGPDRIVTVD